MDEVVTFNIFLKIPFEVITVFFKKDFPLRNLEKMFFKVFYKVKIKLNLKKYRTKNRVSFPKDL